MTVDERIGEALAAEAASWQSGPGLWNEVERRLGRRRRRRRLALAAVPVAAALTLAAVVLALAVLVDSEDRSEVHTIDQPTTTADAPAGVATTAPPPPTMPANFVGVTVDQDVVLVSSSAGRVSRTLYEHESNPEAATGTVTITPDGRTVFFDVVFGDTHEIWSVATSGRRAARVASGCAPAVSGDGQRLAYLEGCSGPLVVRRLATGEEQRIPRGAWDLDLAVYDMEWLGDGPGLAIEATYPEGPGEVYRLDTEAAHSLADAVSLGPPSSGLAPGTWWSSASFRRFDRLLGIVQGCCALDAGSYDGDNRFLVVDPDDGRVIDDFDPSFDVVDVAYDASGHHQLLVDSGGGVHRRQGGEPVAVARGYRTVDW